MWARVGQCVFSISTETCGPETGGELCWKREWPKLEDREEE